MGSFGWLVDAEKRMLTMLDDLRMSGSRVMIIRESKTNALFEMANSHLPESSGSPAAPRMPAALIGLIALSITLGACDAKKVVTAQESPPVQTDSARHVNAAEARTLLAVKRVVVVDVRTPAEFEAGHIRGAQNINFHGADFEQKVAALDRNNVYLVHCASGNRSRQALPLFQKYGFRSIYHLDGGIRAWKEANLPIDQP
jgi:rhodanese-related sulfurtransferase